MTILTARFWGTAAAAAAFAVLASTAQAQEKKVDTKTATKKPPACNSLKVQTGCEARSDCNWVGEVKDGKGKVTKKAYCRANPTPKKK
ncbi:MAG: hypothetical protein EKK41_03995 [Hyphomicrobiales bacterium]|nr:MAG: hypothetical protein EKK41_03995 [Hyphomicrobiales bacterium]